MRTNVAVFSLLAALLASPACDLEPRPKARKTGTNTAAKATAPSAKGPQRDVRNPTRRPPTPTQGAVRAPTQADLVRYTRGLKGKGRLMARIDTTMGAMDCELHGGKTPITVANFIGLARGLHPWQHPQTKKVERRPYYDGLVFHRVIPNFMIQTGDPLGLGNGGPGYKFKSEFHPELKHDKGGILSMAHPARDMNGNGSQFFITERAAKGLDGKHTVFGQCNNVDLIKKIARVEKDPSDRTRARPKTPVKIKKVSIYLGPGVSGKAAEAAPARRPTPVRRTAPVRRPAPTR